MTEKVVKPVPKYILAKIKRLDRKYCPAPQGHVRCYAYLAVWKKELVKITVAVKHYRRQWYCKQVAVHGLDSEKCLVKDMEYCYFTGMGFRFSWYEEGLQKYETWFERGWCYAYDKYYDPYAQIVNPDCIDRLPEFRYCAHKLYHGGNLFKYLRLYRQYPWLELLMKLGFEKIAMSTTILKRCGTDKTFCKWLIANKALLQSRYYYIDVILRAYKTKQPLQRLQSRKEAKLKLIHDTSLSLIKELFRGKELERFFDYIAAKRTDPALLSRLSQSLQSSRVGYDRGQEPFSTRLQALARHPHRPIRHGTRRSGQKSETDALRTICRRCGKISVPAIRQTRHFHLRHRSLPCRPDPRRRNVASLRGPNQL